MTPTQGEATAPQSADPALDRLLWETLRRAARLGHLLPEGALLVQQLHADHPEWREEWLR